MVKVGVPRTDNGRELEEDVDVSFFGVSDQSCLDRHQGRWVRVSGPFRMGYMGGPRVSTRGLTVPHRTSERLCSLEGSFESGPCAEVGYVKSVGKSCQRFWT